MAKNKQPMQSNRVNYQSGYNKLNTGNSFGLLDQLGDDVNILPNGLDNDNNNNGIIDTSLPKPKVGPGRPRADPLSKVSDPAVR